MAGTIYVNSLWSDEAAFTADSNKPADAVWGTNAFATANDAAAAALGNADKMVILEGADVTYNANQWFFLNTAEKEIETDKWSYDVVVDASETYDLQIDGTFSAYQMLLNNAETVVSQSGKLFASGEVLRVMGGSITVDGNREADAGVPEEIFTGNWGIGTKPGADTQIKAGYIQINQGATAAFDNTVVFVNAGWMNFNDATAEFNNSYIYLGSGGSYAPIAVEFVNGAEVTFADNTTLVNDKTFTMNLTVDATSTLTLDSSSSITATTLTVAEGGKFIIDATEFSGIKKIVDLNGTESLAGKVTINGEGVHAIYGADGDITIHTADMSTIYVNSEYAGEIGTDLGDGKIFGINAFADFDYTAGESSAALDIASGTYSSIEGVYNASASLLKDGIVSVTAGDVVIDKGSLVFQTEAAETVKISGNFTAADKIRYTGTWGVDWAESQNGHIRFVGGDDTVFEISGNFISGENIQFIGGKTVIAEDSVLTNNPANWGQYLINGAEVVNYGKMSLDLDAVNGSAMNILGGGSLTLSGEAASLSINMKDGGVTNKDINVTKGSLIVEKGASLATTGAVTVAADGVLDISGSDVDLAAITNNGKITIDTASSITAGVFSGEGSIVIDATGFTGTKNIIDLSGAESLAGKVTIENLGEGIRAVYGADGDVVLTDMVVTEIYVSSEFTGKLGEDLGDGKVFGINAFADFDSAVAALQNDDTVIKLLSDAKMTADSNFKLNVISGDGSDHTLQIDSVLDVDAEFAKEINIDAGLLAAYYNDHEVIVNGDLKGGFYNYTGSLTFNNSKITNSYDNSNIGGVVNINGDGSWTVENPQADNLMFLNVGRADWLGQGILNLNNTVVNAISFDINSSSEEAKSQINAVNSTIGTVMTDGMFGNLNVGANGELNLTNSDLNVVGTLTNNGSVNVAGESTLNIAKTSGNAIKILDGAKITDSNISGAVDLVGGESTWSGENTVTGIFSAGYYNYGGNLTTNITGTFTNGNFLSWAQDGSSTVVNIGSADGDKTTFNGGQIGVFENSTVNITNTDLDYHYIFARGGFNVKDSTLEIGNNGVNTYFAGDAVAVIDNSTWIAGTYTCLGSYNAANATGNADVTVKNGSIFSAYNLTLSDVKEGDDYKVKLTIDNATVNAGIALNVGTGTEVDLKNGTLNVVGTLTNNGSVNVTGESTINAATMTGNYIRFEDATLVGDNVIGGNIRAYGDFALDGTLNVKQSNFYGTTVFKDGAELTGSTTIVGVGAEFTLEDGASINSRFFNVMGIADINGEITLLHSDPRQKLLQLFDGGIVNINEGAVITIDGHNAIINAGGTLNIDGGTLNITKWAQNANDATRGGVLYNEGAVTITADGLLIGSIISGEGTITINAADFTSTQKVLDLNAAESSEGKVTIENLADGVRVVYGADGDIVLTDAKVDALHVDANFAGELGADLGDGKYYGINAFNTISEAIANAAAETAEIRVYSDITEALSGITFYGKIVKGGENDVVITDSANDNYVNLSDFNLGEGVTIDAQYFYLDGENELAGDVKSSTTFYSSGKTTITGNAEVYTAMSRYYSTADAGIYVVGTAEAGEGKNAAVQFKANNYLGHYSGTFSVKDTAAAFGYILLNGAHDGEGYSQAQLVLDNAKVSTIGGPNTQPGQVQMNDDAAIIATNDSVLDFRGPKNFGHLSVGENNTITLTDSIMYLGQEGQGTNTVNGTITLNNSTLDSLGMIKLDGTIALDGSSLVTATKITGAGTFTIDAADFTGTKKVIDLSGTESLAGRVTVTGEGVTALYGADGDVTITSVDTTTVYYNNAWAGAADYTEVEAGKVVGFNAFAKFDWSGTNDKGWSNLLVLPADTEKLVLTAGNDDASYGMLRPTQSVTVETEGEGYAVIDRVVNMGTDLVIAEDAKVKVLCVGGLSGANNQGGQFIINGELYFANANSSNKAIYLWGMNSTPGDMLINAGGLLKADAGNIENHGLITVLGTMELGSAGDAPKLAGVGASNGGWQGQLVVDGAEGEGVVIVKHNQLNFGGGNTWQAWEDAPAGCEVTIKNGGKIETAAVTFRNGKNNTLTVDGGSLIFNDGSAYGVDYSNATATYFDNKGEILVANGGSVDMSGRTFTNDGDITLKDTASFAADSIINNNVIVLDDFAGTIQGANTMSGSILAQGESVLNDDIATNGLYVGFKAGADDEKEVDSLTVNKNVELNNLYVRGTGALNIAEGATIELESGVDGIFASYGTTDISGTLNVANTLSDGNNLIGNTSYANESAVVNVNEGGVFNISSKDGVTGTSLKIDSDGALNILGGEFNADDKTTIDAAGDITVETGEFNAEGTVNLTANFAIGGFTAGEAREITVVFTPAGETEGFTKTYTLDADATELKVSASDIADGEYSLIVIDGASSFMGEVAVDNGNISVTDGVFTAQNVVLGNGSFDVYGESTVVLTKQSGTVNINDGAKISDSVVGAVNVYGTTSWSGTNTIGNMSIGWYNSGADIDTTITGTATVTNFMIGNTSGFTSTLNIGDAEAERTVINGNQHNYTTNSVVNVVNADVTGNYASITGVFNAADSTYSKFGDFRVVASAENAKATFTRSSINGSYGYIGGWSATASGYGVVELNDKSTWKSNGGTLTTANSKVTVNDSDFIVGGTFTHNGSITLENGALLDVNTLTNGGTVTVDDSNVNAKKVTVADTAVFSVSGDSTLTISNFQGVLSVTDGTVFGADTAITVTSGSVVVDGTLTMKQGAVTGAANFTADKLILTDVVLPTDAAITVYTGATAIDELVINGSNVADGRAVIDGVAYDVVINESGISMNVSAEPYTPVTFDITGIEQEIGSYNFTVSVDVTGGEGNYSYQITDVDGNVISNGLEFTLDNPTARMLKLTMSVTDAYGETTSVATKNIFVQVTDYTAPVFNGITASTTEETKRAVILTADFADNFDAAVSGNLTITYSIDGGKSWIAYEDGAKITANGTVIFKATDATGNSTTAEYVVDNIIKEADYDKNGLSDTLFVHDNKLTSAWFTNADDTEITLTDLGAMDDNMDLLGSGRIFGSANDGSDIFFTDGTTVKAWDVQNGAIAGTTEVWKMDANREILGVGDFNGDGATDILIKSNYGDVGAIYAGAESKTTWNYFSSLGSEWKLTGIGDFNGDGVDDVALFNTRDGNAGCWISQEDGSVLWTALDKIPNGEIIGAGDFNGDGVDDVLLRKGDWVGAWIVEDGRAKEVLGLGNITATVEQIADFNGDGIDDLRVRDENMIGVITIDSDGKTQWKEFVGVGDEWKSSNVGIIA